MKYDLAMIGLGNMGISVLGAFLHRGKTCMGIDIDVSKLNALQSGKMIVRESGAAEIFEKARNEKRLDYATGIDQIKNAKVVFISVQTPAKGNECDYSALSGVLRQIALQAAPDQAVIIGSTIFPGGLADELLNELRDRPDIRLIYEPVFLRAGYGIEDYLRPGKLVLGIDDPDNPPPEIAELLSQVVEAEPKWVSLQEAEWIKMVHNAWMCGKISFANEMGALCDEYKVDTNRIFDICFSENAQGRLMTLSHMKPGAPYSGPCLPKDATILGGILEKQGRPWMQSGSVLEALRVSNENYIDAIVEQWLATGRETGKPLGLVGLTFRPGFDEMRGSLALPFIRRALAEGLEVRGYDPFFDGIGIEEFMLVCRNDKELESYHAHCSHSLESVWNECGVVLLNRNLDINERRRLDDFSDCPRKIDLYGNKF
ncbi:MAG: nucleotide sugar dehydrogenase [Candidatus Nitrohelix vancouverensis]|uniref:UDP-glucose 6-dehydrogenase n=1 Tax=Candidatus Nitrohelix vancouverensis TaxID=2705534 RepID=A0A7T0G3G2_9BACT|nr:MAG: nucleotide sugar dehydrogenase [Candidatus Nitrohelix vancouverensis]